MEKYRWLLVGLAVVFAGCAAYHDGIGEEDAVLLLIMPPSEIILGTPSITVNIACDSVFNTGSTGDWNQANITVTSTVSIPQGKACRLTITSFYDGTNNYLPVGSSLVVAISSTGVVSTSSSFQYTTVSAIQQWLLAKQGASPYTLVLSYAAQLVSATTSVSPTTMPLQNMSDALSQVVAPTVANLTLTETKVLLITYDTLTANVTNSTGCKYIDNSGASPTYTASSWVSVNTAYNNASAAACPIMIPGSPLLLLGNWTLLWKPGIKTLVMWANTLNGVTAYTTAMVGP